MAQAQRWFSTSRQSLPIAVVGTGPAGFYTAKYLLAGNEDVTVDLYDALPTPFGTKRRRNCVLLPSPPCRCETQDL